MDYSNLITEKSEIDLGEHYISIKNLKAKISKSFNTNIIAESNDSFSCKIIRMARLYGAPVPFPNPTYKVKLIGEGKNTKIMSELLVYDYFVVYAGSLLFIILALYNVPWGESAENLLWKFSLPIAFFIFSSLAVFLDSKYFHHLLKKELRQEIEQYKV